MGNQFQNFGAANTFFGTNNIGTSRTFGQTSQQRVTLDQPPSSTENTFTLSELIAMTPEQMASLPPEQISYFISSLTQDQIEFLKSRLSAKQMEVLKKYFLENYNSVSSQANSDSNVANQESVPSSPSSGDKVKKNLEKIDLLISVLSKPSLGLEFNSLDVPETTAEFIYNFYEKKEEDIAIQEDYSLDPLLSEKIYDVPKYVELRWEQASLKEKVEIQKNLTPEEIWYRDHVFSPPKGAADTEGNSFGSNGYETYIKDENLYSREGSKSKLVDVHKIDEAFGTLSNERRYGLIPKYKVDTTKVVSGNGVSLEKLLTYKKEEK